MKMFGLTGAVLVLLVVQTVQAETRWGQLAQFDAETVANETTNDSVELNTAWGRVSTGWGGGCGCGQVWDNYCAGRRSGCPMCNGRKLFHGWGHGGDCGKPACRHLHFPKRHCRDHGCGGWTHRFAHRSGCGDCGGCPMRHAGHWLRHHLRRGCGCDGSGLEGHESWEEMPSSDQNDIGPAPEPISDEVEAGEARSASRSWILPSTRQLLPIRLLSIE